ncbi:response regulator transcription factor [Flaviaesturariibacter flavus]|uniref:Response regulator transcription factor n=1 Tax=Flaviaesturariibacter flavus TaxID=2502780 RepID=A0A4V2NV79_9BACT|nr:response regulator transcription factor [Flaviaesturariibacter flavus]TCJ12436.1 response regulator transcription factor [Flaviaesturariibacter flavus]
MEPSKILLVEDEHKIADTLSTGLAENGYEVGVAYDGNSGLEQFSNGTFDLVVLDINLPGINGIELCRRIRAVNAQVPVVMLTALRTINDKEEGYESGADDYITKPFEFRELLMKIRVLLKRSQTPQPPPENILRAADLELMPDRKEVRRNGHVIHLTAKEFQLLEFLLRNKNRVVSRADIALNVWDIDFDTNTNVIDVYINYLRNKVDKPFDQKLIHTQVGMGYILRENNS